MPSPAPRRILKTPKPDCVKQPPTRASDKLQRNFSTAHHVLDDLVQRTAKFTPTNDASANHLKLSNLFRTLASALPEISDADGDIALPPRDDPKFHRAEVLLKRALHQLTAGTAHALVLTSPTGSEAYARLFNIYLRIDPIHVRRRLRTISYYQFDSVPEYVDAFRALLEQLDQLDEPVSEDWKSEMFVEGLRSTSSHVDPDIAAQYMYFRDSPGKIPLDNLIRRLESSKGAPSPQSPPPFSAPSIFDGIDEHLHPYTSFIINTEANVSLIPAPSPLLSSQQYPLGSLPSFNSASTIIVARNIRHSVAFEICETGFLLTSTGHFVPTSVKSLVVPTLPSRIFSTQNIVAAGGRVHFGPSPRLVLPDGNVVPLFYSSQRCMLRIYRPTHKRKR